MARKESFDNLSIDSETTYPSNGNSRDSGLPTSKIPGDYALQTNFKFGGEGSSTTSTAYNAIFDSDVTIDFDRIKDGNGDVYVNVLYHVKGDISARIYRQNAGTDVSGTTVSKGTTGWDYLESGWINMSSESGFDSYQVQIRSDDGNEVEYNSIIMLVATPQG